MSKRTGMMWIAAAALMCCATAQGSGGAILLNEEREVFAGVIVPPCDQQPLFTTVTADGFDPFDVTIEAEDECEAAGVLSIAAQDSVIEPLLMSGSGSFVFDAHSSIVTVFHSFGRSEYEVTFEVPFPRAFALSGEIEAMRTSLPVLLAVAEVRLTGPGGVTIVDEAVAAPFGGEVVESEFAFNGTLEPGVYTLYARAEGFLDGGLGGGPYPPDAAADGAFDFTFEIDPGIPGDLNGDGVVDVFDLLLLLQMWGECPPFGFWCPDLTGDGSVGVLDLLILLENWTGGR